jgi:hypothetical protein
MMKLRGKVKGFRWPGRPITRAAPVTRKFSTPNVRIEQSWLVGAFCILPFFFELHPKQSSRGFI